MNYWEFDSAVQDAENTLKRADQMVEKILPLLPTRLRNVQSYKSIEALKKIKKELTSFNATTGEWKN